MSLATAHGNVLPGTELNSLEVSHGQEGTREDRFGAPRASGPHRAQAEIPQRITTPGDQWLEGLPRSGRSYGCRGAPDAARRVARCWKDRRACQSRAPK